MPAIFHILRAAIKFSDENDSIVMILARARALRFCVRRLQRVFARRRALETRTPRLSSNFPNPLQVLHCSCYIMLRACVCLTKTLGKYYNQVAIIWHLSCVVNTPNKFYLLAKGLNCSRFFTSNKKHL
jgi:hypothetical protein